jgi:hypothetical protein
MRAGVKISRASVRRILEEEPPEREPESHEPEKKEEESKPCSLLKPKATNETWHLDLTTIQFLWFHWTIVGLMDGFSRKLLALKLFARIPSTDQIVRVVRKAVRDEGTPRFLITEGNSRISLRRR